MKRREQQYVGRKTVEMVPPGRIRGGRPKPRWMDCVNRDMRAIGTTKDEVHDRTGWRRIVSAAATPRAAGRRSFYFSAPCFSRVSIFHCPWQEGLSCNWPTSFHDNNHEN